MWIEKRQTKDGYYYSFTYLDEKTGKRIRMPKGSYPHFTDLKEAEAWAKSQVAFRESMKAKIAQRLAWKSKYYDFENLINRYADHQKKSAPNSWQNNVTYLKYYTILFFLEKKKASNVNDWQFLMQEYRDWLEDEALTMKSRKKLSYSTKNHAIGALNTFISFLKTYGLINPECVKVCETFPKSKLNEKEYDDVVEEPEFRKVYGDLIKIDAATADFYYVLYHTGMRFNELFSLPITGLYPGIVSGPVHDELVAHSISYFGYIVLESQGEDKRRHRENDGSIKRKPLKGRLKIHEKNNRIVPIMDKDCWNILVRRFRGQEAEFERKTFGTSKENYMFFEDVEPSKAKRSLDTVYRTLKIEQKPFHNLRHSFATLLVGRTRSYFLARTVLGHKSTIFEKYIHIFEKISRKAKQKAQSINFVA